MRTLLRIVFAVFVLLFCFSIISAVTALFVPSVHLSHEIGQSWVHSPEYLVTQPVRVVQTQPSILLWLLSILVVAVLLRWAFGGRRHEGHADRHQETSPESNVDMEALARDLQYTARRLEERLDALETILLDRTKSRL